MANSTLKPMIDSHCHLDLACFSDDIDAVISRALDVGVGHFIIPGIDPTHWQQSQTLAQRYPQISYTLGYHPFFLPLSLTHADIPALIDSLKLAISTSCIGIGEIGIDRTLALSIDIQIEMFDAQVGLAQQLGLPLIIHHRKSHDLIIGRLKQAKFSFGGIIHAFSGNQAIAQAYIDLGFCLGVGGTITYPRGDKTRQALLAVGLEHCVLETDSPDMPMHGRQGQRNEPQYLVDVLKVLERTFVGHDVVGKTNENVQRLFSLAVI
ncbi:MAG: TatD family hydrolase [Glaciecola sp.]|nr:TatD family hydrolase [Glaciecola sp.]MDG1815965.1 TatD family hydrolase [Glaciecola sp.]MDG2099750.1 TatD family hydrolase [Glaciecola sp.]